jgi:hypothetical protein
MLIPSEIVVAVITASGTLLSMYLKNKYDKDKIKKTNVVIDSFTNDEAILNKITEIMDKVNSDRIYILEFHNGGKFYSGRSMQRFTMSYEICRPGISHEETKYQGLLLSNFNNFAKAYIQNSIIAIPDIAKVSNDNLRDIYSHDGVESVYIYPINDLNDKTIGLMVVNYIRDKKDLTVQEIEYIRQNAELISGYL